MASTLSKALAAGRLAALASGQTSVDDQAFLDKALGILADFEPAERREVADTAVRLGADPAIIMTIMNLAGGEVINVVGQLPRRGAFWWWLLGGAAVAAGATGYAVHRSRKRRRLAR